MVLRWILSYMVIIKIYMLFVRNIWNGQLFYFWESSFKNCIFMLDNDYM